MGILISTCSQGLIWAVLALGLYITFRILNFADMTAEGSLTLGGAVTGLLIFSGVNPYLSVMVAFLAGSLAGFATGILHTKFKIQDILSGILTMISLYSINLAVMKKANISLLGKSNIFNLFHKNSGFGINFNLSIFFVSLIVCFVLILSMDLFFKTEIGLAIRATGDNESMMRAQGANTDLKKILALMLSNGICAIAGSLIAQSQGYSDINMGAGSIVIAFASIVIGETILKNEKFILKLAATVIGSIVYRIIIWGVLAFGMNPRDLKLFTAITATALLAFSNLKKSRKIINLRNK